jgi:glycosyltransferase involved in cell wall biosynthesis
LPVIIADNTCLPEVGGDAVLQFDPFNVNDMAAKIKAALDDAGLREDMVKKGRERLELFSWRTTALQLIEVFKKVV